MIRTILVAGVENKAGGDNSVLRFVNDHFLRPTHIPELSRLNPMVPNLDAAILAVTASSHDLSGRVRDVYRDKPLFYCRGGISSIREDFEKAVYGEGVLQKLRSVDVHRTLKVAYILGRFFAKGESFIIKEFAPKFEKLLGESFQNNVSGPALSGLKNKGVVQGEGQGLYVFKGLTDKMYDQLLEHGIFLEKELPTAD